MIPVTNKQLLVGLIALGVFNALVCVVVMLRENANGVRLALLEAELGTTREDLARTTGALRKTREALEATAHTLTKTQSELDHVRETLAEYRSNPPWQARVPRLQERLSNLEKGLKELQPMPDKKKPPTPLPKDPN